MSVEREQRHTRSNPCPICSGGEDMRRGEGRRCAGFTSEDGAWVRCERRGEAEGAEWDERCLPPAYKWKRQEDGTYRPWTKEPPPTAIRVHRSRGEPQNAHGGRSVQDAGGNALPDAPYEKTHPRVADTRYFSYNDTQRVRREDYQETDEATGERVWMKRIRPEYLAGGQWHTGEGPEPIARVYRAEDLARPEWQADRVFLVEGEATADVLRTAGFLAVTWRGGAARTAKAIPQLIDALAGRDVVLLPDADKPGREAMRLIGNALAGKVVRLQWCDLFPGEGGGRDAEDWLHEHNRDTDAFAALLDIARDYEPLEDTTEATEPAVSTGVWQPKITRLSDVPPERVRWLWHGRVALGKVGLIDGDPGDGKSTLTIDLAARVSTGRAMPDGTPGLGYGAGVVLLSAEDGLADTIRPRLDAAGGDASCVVALECATDGERERGVTLTDLPMIEAAIARVNARLVIVDPLMAYLGSETNSYRDQDVRGILAPLARLAERTGVAILVVRHFSKAVGGKVIHKGGGSVGIVGAVRTAMMVARDPEDPEGPRRILAQTKSNIAVFPPALAFHMEETANGMARVAWEGATAHTAAELVAVSPDGEERGALDEACEVLRQILVNGQIDVGTAMVEAKNAGISERTLKRAKKSLGVVSTRNGFGKGAVWFWELPPEGEHHRLPTEPIECQSKRDGTVWDALAPYDDSEREALPDEGGNVEHTIECQPRGENVTPEDLAWAKAHIASGALSLVASDLARVRRLCGGGFDTRTWRADVCARYEWPAPPSLAAPDTTPGEGMNPARYTREQMWTWLDHAAKQPHLADIPAGVLNYGAVRGVRRRSDEPLTTYVARLRVALFNHAG